jgi:ATP-dependent Clp protease ATP-binding subunit ClpC
MDVLRAAAEEALRLGHNYVGTEHQLLALFRAPGDPAGAILTGLGADPDDLRRRVIEKLAALRI